MSVLGFYFSMYKNIMILKNVVKKMGSDGAIRDDLCLESLSEPVFCQFRA